MKLISELKNATESERIDFIVTYNHQQGYTVKEEMTEDGDEKRYNLKAFGYTDEEKTGIRQKAFLRDFFKVEGYGYYRRVPKGYQSAVESMNVLFNIANVSDGIQAGLIIFYQKPDFTKPKECTEEWLVAHQIVMSAMTKVDFMNLYKAFMTAWNMEEHK